MSSSAALRIALLEDDAILRDRVLQPGLLSYGFAVTGMETVAELHKCVETAPIDLVVLDLGLPDGDGFSVARELRKTRPRLGLVVLTGRRASEDHMRGLNEGADAYLTKPVEIGVLAATLHSLARRIGSVEEEVQVELGRWMLHADGWSMGSPCGAMVALTGNERRLMKSLFHADGSVMKREALLEALSTDGGLDIDPHRLDSVIHRLRSKVARHTSAPFPLLAVYGEGYVLRTV